MLFNSLSKQTRQIFRLEKNYIVNVNSCYLCFYLVWLDWVDCEVESIKEEHE